MSAGGGFRATRREGAVRIVAGETSRSKVVEVDGVAPERVMSLAASRTDAR